MIFSVVISERAHRDIERNAIWWAEHQSIDQAFEWQAAVYSQIAAIAAMPES